MRHLHALVLAAVATLPAVAAEPAPPPFELILNNPVGRPAPSTACDVALCQSLVTLIEGAQTSIDFALYGVRGQPDIARALVEAQARGVTVRGYVDRTLDGKNYYTDTEALVEALGTVRDDLSVDRRRAESQRPYDPSSNRCWLDLPWPTEGPKQCVGFDLGDRCA